MTKEELEAIRQVVRGELAAFEERIAYLAVEALRGWAEKARIPT